MIVSSWSLDNDLPVLWACSFPGTHLKDTGARALGKRTLQFLQLLPNLKNVCKRPQKAPPAPQMLRASARSARRGRGTRQVEQPNAPAAGEERAPEPKRILSETWKLQIQSRHPLGTETEASPPRCRPPGGFLLRDQAAFTLWRQRGMRCVHPD